MRPFISQEDDELCLFLKRCQQLLTSAFCLCFLALTLATAESPENINFLPFSTGIYFQIKLSKFDFFLSQNSISGGGCGEGEKGDKSYQKQLSLESSSPLSNDTFVSRPKLFNQVVGTRHFVQPVFLQLSTHESRLTPKLKTS